MKRDRPSAGELIANNAIHAGFVAGQGVRPDDIHGATTLDLSALSSFADDRLPEQCTGAALIETNNTSLKWLTESVRKRGDRLRPGQIILTGSIPGLIPIADDSRIRVDVTPLGDVNVSFIPGLLFWIGRGLTATMRRT